jgi:PAS domain S-box-containing protein
VTPAADKKLNKAALYIAVLAILVPVAGAFSVDRVFFMHLFDNHITHVLMETVSCILSLATAGFLFARMREPKLGSRFWMATSMLAMGILFGYHGITLGAEWTGLLHNVGVFLGASLMMCNWLPRVRITTFWIKFLSIMVILVATAAGVILQVHSGLQALLNHPWLAYVNIVSGVFFMLAALRLFMLYKREGHPTNFWFVIINLLFGVGALSFYWSSNPEDWWFWHVCRSTSYALLFSYLLVCMSWEFRQLESISNKLNSSEMRFRAITENTSDIIFVLNRKGRFSYVSPAAARVAGVKEEDLLGREPGSKTHPNDKHKTEKGLAEARKNPGKTIAIGTIRVIHANGSMLYLEGMYTCLYDNPSVAGIVLNYRDISDRVKSERELVESRRRQATLVANLPGMAYRYLNDGNHTLDYVSQGCQQLTGYSAKALCMDRSADASMLIHPDDIDEMRETIRQAVSKSEPFNVQYRIITADNEEKWVWERGMGVENEVGQVEYVEGLVMDISQNVKAEQQLRRTKYSMENASDAIYWIGRDGSLLDVNETACRTLGYTREQLLNMNIHQISSDLDPLRWDDVWDDVMNAGWVIIEGTHITSTGREFPVEISSNYMEFDGKQYHCAFVRDISERKDAEASIHRMNLQLEQRVLERTSELEDAQAKLVTSEKMAALGNLVAGVAHEINTPLGIGLTATSHLSERLDHYLKLYKEGRLTKSEFEVFLDLINESTSMILANLKRAAELIHGFKQVSVDQSSERRRKFDLGEYINEILISLRPKLKWTKHGVELDCPEGIEVDSYPGAIAQLLTNLVMNSITHGFEEQEGGRIWIKVDHDDSQIHMIIADDGKGMTRDQLDKIYDPFFTTKRGRGGSGLGMNVVYNLVTQVLGGSIECQSELGKGAVFDVTFPKVIFSEVDKLVTQSYADKQDTVNNRY